MQPDDPYVPIDVVAKHFGVSLSTVRAWLNRGYIPIASYIQVGNTRRFKINMLEEAFRDNTDTKPDTTSQESVDVDSDKLDSMEDFFEEM